MEKAELDNLIYDREQLWQYSRTWPTWYSSANNNNVYLFLLFLKFHVTDKVILNLKPAFIIKRAENIIF